MKKIVSILFFFLGILSFSYSQEPEIRPLVVRAIILNGDTIPSISLREVEIITLVIPRTRKEQKQMTKLIYNVKKVYPYAKLAGIQLRRYDKMLSEAKNDKERKKIMKQAEQEINEQYGGELRDLTFSQGKILIKLIDRETGETSYNLVSELRGNFTAFFYQAFARLWGYNLKVKYDPEGEDAQIEAIVKMIERGQI
ncbi:MAG TPA: DUF4294 domain-containing protein [Bacteroidales bacterium]